MFKLITLLRSKSLLKSTYVVSPQKHIVVTHLKHLFKRLTLSITKIVSLKNITISLFKYLPAFFNDLFSQKNVSGTLSECQTVWLQIRTDVLSVLIWVQTVCKGYQQMTKSMLSRKALKPWVKLR